MAESEEQTEALKEIQETFKGYRVQFDQTHDLYEKLVKKSRDVTIESKRIIFLLHRQNKTDSKENVLDDSRKRLQEVYKNVIYGIGSLLISKDIHQFWSAFSPGMQEFVEALSFYYYIKHEEVISLEQIRDGQFLFDKNINVEELTDDTKMLPMSSLLNPKDYILGLADLTGELMRKCVASGNLEEPFRLRTVLKDIYSAFLLIGNSGGREMARKTSTLKASLHKVENVCYLIRVRGSELENLQAKGIIATGRLTLDDLFNAPQMVPSIEDSFS